MSISLAFILGCVASSSRYGVARAEAAAVVEQRWSYFCFEASTVDDVHFKANAAGLRGWAQTLPLQETIPAPRLDAAPHQFH